MLFYSYVVASLALLHGYTQAHACACIHMHTHTECLHSRVPRQISLQPLFVPWRVVIEITVNSSQFCCCCFVHYFKTKIDFTSWLSYSHILFVLASVVGKDSSLNINYCFIMSCKQPAFCDKRILEKLGDNKPKAIRMAHYLTM